MPDWLTIILLMIALVWAQSILNALRGIHDQLGEISRELRQQRHELEAHTSAITSAISDTIPADED